MVDEEGSIPFSPQNTDLDLDRGPEQTVCMVEYSAKPYIISIKPTLETSNPLPANNRYKPRIIDGINNTAVNKSMYRKISSSLGMLFFQLFLPRILLIVSCLGLDTSSFTRLQPSIRPVEARVACITGIGAKHGI